MFRSLTLLSGFAFQIMVVKLLTPESYAAFAVFLATILVGERLLSCGTDRTILRFAPMLLLRKDWSGLEAFARRITLFRISCLVVFGILLTASYEMHLTPIALGGFTATAFGVWFAAYSVLKDSEAAAQSLIAHHWAAIIAAGEATLRLVGLSLLYAIHWPITVATVISLYALTSSSATSALVWCVWVVFRERYRTAVEAPSEETDVVIDVKRQAPRFAFAAYSSTLSYLISSPGVIRLVARAGLSIYTFAGFSFIQGLSTSLASALPGQLVLPSLESIVAKMKDSGRGNEMFPVLSVLFKVELTIVLSIVLATALAGPNFIRILSRPAYAQYFYILPILMIGLCLHTVYRVLEILGSVHLKYKIFLGLWPLSTAALVALYFTVGRWGVLSVLAIPLIEILGRVGILTYAFRSHGTWRALDLAQSFRLVLTASLVLACFQFVPTMNIEPALGLHTFSPFLGVGAFIGSLVIIRPFNSLEFEAISRFLPESWSLPRYLFKKCSRT